MTRARISASRKTGERNGELETDVEPTKASYTVKPGETLWTIADEVLGDGNRYPDILRANPALNGDADRIYPGQVIILP